MHKVCRVDVEKGGELFEGIREFARSLRARYKIAKIFLFGSFAKGDFNEGSDIDLIIIGDIPGNQMERIAEVLALTDLPIEPLVYSREEWVEMRSSPFMREALKHKIEL